MWAKTFLLTKSPLTVPRCLTGSAADNSKVRGWLKFCHTPGQRIWSVHSLAQGSCSCLPETQSWECVVATPPVKTWGGIKAVEVRQLSGGPRGSLKPLGQGIKSPEKQLQRGMWKKPTWWEVKAWGCLKDIRLVVGSWTAATFGAQLPVVFEARRVVAGGCVERL